MRKARSTAIAMALLLSSSFMAMAANDGQSRVSELLSADQAYRDTWQAVVKKQERLPQWVINLSGASEPMTALQEDGKQYLVGPLCETEQSCRTQRLIVAFSWNKKEAYALLVEVPVGLPADKSPSQHAEYRWLGEPDEGIQAVLKEQLKKDAHWY